MGASTFYDVAYGRTPEEAFDAAVREAEYDYGHAGYTGTIAEKHDFVMIDETWKTRKYYYAKQVRGLTALIADVTNTPASKWGLTRDGFLRRGKANGMGYFDAEKAARSKSKFLEVCRHRKKKLREERDRWTRKSSLYDVAEDLIEVGDDRIDDKWGPAGCIDLQPKLTGKRKPKAWLFFGWASS